MYYIKDGVCEFTNNPEVMEVEDDDDFNQIVVAVMTYISKMTARRSRKQNARLASDIKGLRAFLEAAADLIETENPLQP